MKFGVPWSVKGIRPEARETAKEAARRSGVSLGEWLNAVIIEQAEQEGVPAPSHDDEDSYGDDIATVNERLDDLTRRIEQLTRSGPEAKLVEWAFVRGVTAVRRRDWVLADDGLLVTLPVGSEAVDVGRID